MENKVDDSLTQKLVIEHRIMLDYDIRGVTHTNNILNPSTQVYVFDKDIV